MTIHVNSRKIDAIAAVSKTGFVYVFDRVTGEPVWPIEEHTVPQSDVPGEQTSPTQPFPTKPPAFAKQGFNPETDVVDFTPELKAMALEKIKNYRAGPIFNPPSIQGTLMIPSNVGGTGWGGAAAEEERGILYVKGENILQVIRITRVFTDDERRGIMNPSVDRPGDSVLITPKVADTIPINKPPYSTIAAVDLNKGEFIWQAANGDMPEVRNHPLLKGLNFPPTGVISRGMGFGRTGPVVTAGGLLFIGPGDHKFYARDKDNGKILWSADIPNDVAGNPMTYRTRSGKQYVVVATGLGSESTLVAFALP